MTENTERAQVGWGFGLGWVVATPVGFVMAAAFLIAVGDAAADAVEDAVGQAVGLALGITVFGAAVGIAQWFLLRREVSRAGRWVLASTVGVALGFAVIFAVGEVVASPVGKDVGNDVASAVEETMGGAVASAMGREVANVVAPAVEEAMGGDVASAVEEVMEEALEEARIGDVGYDVEDAVEEAVDKAVEETMGGDVGSVGYDVASVLGEAVLNALEEAAEEAVFDAVEEGVFDAAEDDVASAVEEAVASAVGEAMGSTVKEAVVNAVEEAIEEDVVEETLASVASVEGLAMFGAAVGIAQWFVLRREVSRAGWWVLASTVGLALGGAVFLAASERMMRTMRIGFFSLPNAEDVLGFVLGLALYGAITGGVLVWLLRQPEEAEPRAPNALLEKLRFGPDVSNRTRLRSWLLVAAAFLILLIAVYFLFTTIMVDEPTFETQFPLCSEASPGPIVRCRIERAYCNVKSGIDGRPKTTCYDAPIDSRSFTLEAFGWDLGLLDGSCLLVTGEVVEEPGEIPGINLVSPYSQTAFCQQHD